MPTLFPVLIVLVLFAPPGDRALSVADKPKPLTVDEIKRELGAIKNFLKDREIVELRTLVVLLDEEIWRNATLSRDVDIVTLVTFEAKPEIRKLWKALTRVAEFRFPSCARPLVKNLAFSVYSEGELRCLEPRKANARPRVSQRAIAGLKREIANMPAKKRYPAIAAIGQIGAPCVSLLLKRLKTEDPDPTATGSRRFDRRLVVTALVEIYKLGGGDAAGLARLRIELEAKKAKGKQRDRLLASLKEPVLKPPRR